jgi:hypothetical protein
VQHSIHHVPVAWVAWVCTGLAGALVVFVALPSAIRRLDVPGRRALGRVLLLLSLVAIGVAAEVFLDAGNRWHVGEAHASISVAEMARSVVAAAPFPMTSYDALRLRLAHDSSVLGSIPELVIPVASWTDVRTHRAVALTLVGLPSDLSPTFYVGRPIASELGGVVRGWQAKLARLTLGHVYVNGVASNRFGVKPHDELTALVGGQYQFLTVDGVLPRGDVMAHPPAMFTTLSQVQSLYKLTGRGSGTLVFFLARQPGDGPQVEPTIIAKSSLLGAVTSRAGASFVFESLRGSPLDASRRLAIGALCLVAAASLCLLVMGRRSLTRRSTDH